MSSISHLKDIFLDSNLQKFGELEHIILDWPHSGLLLKNVNPDIQKLVKKQAIEKFDEFDEEHKYSWYFGRADNNTINTLKMLQEAGLMDKDTYIGLYQRALNRNYDLEEFDDIACRFIDYDERMKALDEIVKLNSYYPSPKKKWQKEKNSWKKNHRIPKIEIPNKVAKKGKVRDKIKKEILEQGIAKKTKIKTTMKGISKDEKEIIVDNLKDWLFGVPGAHGNLQIMGDTAIAFPPQTPKFAIDLVKQTLREIENMQLEER